MTEFEGVQHMQARKIVELYLLFKGRTITTDNLIRFKTEFVRDFKLGKRYAGHSYDIMTEDEIIEIDDLNSHPKKSHKINDGIAEAYVKEYHPEFKFYRLLKEEIVDTHGRLLKPSDVADYLRTHLF